MAMVSDELLPSVPALPPSSDRPLRSRGAEDRRRRLSWTQERVKAARRSSVSAVEFRVLGPLEVLDDGRPLDLGAPRQRALLAVLLLHANEVVSTDRLAEALWPEESATAAEGDPGLRLRAPQGARRPARRARDPRPRLSAPRRPGELDLHEFERLLAVARPGAGSARRDASHARSLWRASRSPTSSTSRSSSRRPRGSTSCVSSPSRIASRPSSSEGGPELDRRAAGARRRAAAAGAAARAPHARALPRGSPVGGARRLSRGQAAARRGARSRPGAGAARAGAGDPAPGSRALGARRLRGGAPGDRRRPGAARPRPAAPARRSARRARTRRGLVLARIVPPPSCRRRRRRSSGRRDLVARGRRFASPRSRRRLPEDVVRLVEKQDADLLLLSSGGDPLDGPLAPVFDAATLISRCSSSGRSARVGAVVVPFGAFEHDWAALEIGAWAAAALERPLRLIGAVDEARAAAMRAGCSRTPR